MTKTSIAVLTTLLLAGCADSPVDDSSIPGCEGKCDGFGEVEPIAGPDSLVRCERDGVGNIQCDYVGVPTSFPIEVSVAVSVVAGSESATADFTEARNVTLLRAAESVPASVVLVLRVTNPFIRGDFGDLGDFVHMGELLVEGDATPDLPIPFEFWPVRLFAESGSLAVVESAQTFDISPWDGVGSAEREGMFSFPVVEEEPVDLLLPVVPGTRQVVASATQYCDDAGCIEYDFVLDGPGVYRLGRDGVTSFATPAPSVDGGVDGGTDAGLPDSGPICGLNGLPPCEDGLCADDHHLVDGLCAECGTEGRGLCAGAVRCSEGHYEVDALCRACGSDSQVACENADGRFCNVGHFHDMALQVCSVCGGDDQVACGTLESRFCLDGHFHDSLNDTCAACGADGQVACEESGERFCDEWHQHDTIDQTCSACGRDAQASCQRPSGERFCDEWHQHDRMNETCAACGNDGEDACADLNGARFCNEGHFRDGSNMCVACGDDGEVACADSNGRRFCNDGHYRDGSNMCVACGDDGEVACADSNGARFCNEGHYRDGSSMCTACGDDGQVACADSNGARFCNDGHFRDGSSMCAACGDDGEVACADVNGRRFCNEGLRLNGTMCVPE